MASLSATPSLLSMPMLSKKRQDVKKKCHSLRLPIDIGILDVSFFSATIRFKNTVIYG